MIASIVKESNVCQCHCIQASLDGVRVPASFLAIVERIRF